MVPQHQLIIRSFFEWSQNRPIGNAKGRDSVFTSFTFGRLTRIRVYKNFLTESFQRFKNFLLIDLFLAKFEHNYYFCGPKRHVPLHSTNIKLNVFIMKYIYIRSSANR
jgi:hypothetical protein